MKNRQLHLKTMHGKLLCIKKIPAPDIKGKIKLVAKDLIVLSVRSKLNKSTSFEPTNGNLYFNG
jgi:hypothetical protein